MYKLKEIFKKMTKFQKFSCLILILIFFLLVAISVPSLAKLKNRVTLYNASVWDGLVATEYKSGDGTLENPYIISNGSELAYFSKQLEENDYENTYFKLSNDIMLNDGVFDYNETDGIMYIVNDVTYYVEEYSNNYYNNKEYSGDPVGTLNTFSSLENFKGNLNGNSYTIYGLYITDSEEEELGLFTNLEGVLNDLYVENSVIYGGNVTGGIASSSTNSTISNVLYDGYVVSNNKILNNIVSLSPTSINALTTESTTNVNINTPSIEGSVLSTTLTGDYVVNNTSANTTIKINGIVVENGHFEIDMGTNLQNQVQVVTVSDSEGVMVNFTNLSYTINYNNNITSGIVGNSTNTSILNVINKSDVYGSYITSGIVGIVNNSLQITQSYNTGSINSKNLASGLIGVIKNNSNPVGISNSYNSGVVTATTSSGLIGYVSSNTGLINIENSFNTSENYSIATVVDSTVNVTNSYNTNGLSIYNGVLTTNFVQTDLTKFYDTTFLNETLGYKGFVSFEDLEQNSNNVWYYEKNSLPILYIDNLNNPVASINISKYNWNNLSQNLDIINLESSIAFNIEDLSSTRPVKERYYYISNSMTPLTEEELSNLSNWSEYSEIVQIDESGYYVIYAKIVEYDGTVTYINSDILALNKSGFNVNIYLENQIWSTFKTDLNNFYIDQAKNININAVNDLIGISSIQYYISDAVLTEDILNNLEWINYTENISITSPGKYIIYAKVTDNEQNIKYVNTDYIIFTGYNRTVSLGQNDIEYNSNNITDNSTIKLQFSSDYELEYLDGYTHNFVSNILLPVNTKITLIDNFSKKIYTYKIETEEDIYGYAESCNDSLNCSNKATYSFDLFKEIGTSTDKFYSEEENYNKTLTAENYTLIVDLSDATIIQNYYDVSFALMIKDETDNSIINTLNSSSGNINIYLDNTDITSSVYLNSDYSNQSISYNDDSTTTINLTSGVTYNTLNEQSIINTIYEEKNIGLEIKVVDGAGNTISRDILKGMILKVNGEEYNFNSNNIIRVNLGNVLDKTSKPLTIITKQGSNNLSEGTYYLKINNYISDSGYTYENLGSSEISIPIVASSNIPNYGSSLSVEFLNDSIALDKTIELQKVSFNINLLKEVSNPIIKVSLFEKETLTAFDQNYVLINLNDYISNTFTETLDYNYYIGNTSMVLELDLIPNKLNNNGYKYVFELYDGTNKIDKIEKYFIVK